MSQYDTVPLFIGIIVSEVSSSSNLRSHHTVAKGLNQQNSHRTFSRENKAKVSKSLERINYLHGFK